MSNEVMTRNSEWMNHIVNHLNRMVDNFERAVMNYRPMLDGERFMTDKGALCQAATEPKNPAGLPKQRCHPVYPAWRKDTLPRVRHSEDSDG